MDTSSTLADEVEEGLGGSCDFSFSQYPPVQLPLDPTRHIKQPLKGFVVVICLLVNLFAFAANKLVKSSTNAAKQDGETSHVPTAADLFSNPVCYHM